MGLVRENRQGGGYWEAPWGPASGRQLRERVGATAAPAEQRHWATSSSQHHLIAANRQENQPVLGTPQRSTSRRCQVRTTWTGTHNTPGSPW